MEKDVRIIVAGGRKYDDYETLSKYMDKFIKLKKFGDDAQITIVCGCADGADLLGKRYAEEKGYKVELFPANWNLLGKCAGILRNAEMAKFAEGGEGYLVAFWNGKSKGTKNMIDTAIQHKLSVQIFSYDDPLDRSNDIIHEYIGNITEMFDSMFAEFTKHGLFNTSEKENKSKDDGIGISGDTKSDSDDKEDIKYTNNKNNDVHISIERIG